MNTCEFIETFHQPSGNAVSCGVPAGLKREGVWLCSEHFDRLENGESCNWVGTDGRWIPFELARPEKIF